MAEFEQALAAYRQLVVDMDGDGIPDAPLQAPMQPERFRQRLERDPRGQINPPELRSYTPTAGDRVRQATGSPMAGQVTNAMLQYGPIPAQEFVNQPIRTGNAINEAIQDPTLANVTNAGVQSALTAFRPGAAMGVLGAGYGVAAARDLGLDPFSGAQAQEPPQTGAPPDEMTQLLTRQQQLLQQQARAQAEVDRWRPTNRAPSSTKDPKWYAATQEYDRINAQVLALDEQISQIREANSPEARLAAEKAAAEQAEYQRSIQRAETMRDTELARDRRFSDTEVGKVFDATGGLAPVAAGVAGGAIGRMAHGPPNSMLSRFAVPAVEGAGLTFTAANVPLLYNALLTEPDNPEKAGYMAYARELPPGHPRKQEFMDYAQGLPDQNPVREQASREFYDEMPKRAIMSAIEGGLGGLLGANVVNVGSRARNAMLGSGTQPPTPPAPRPKRQKLPNGQVVYRTPSGHFAPNPKKKTP